MDFRARIRKVPRANLFTEEGYYVWCGTMFRFGGVYYIFLRGLKRGTRNGIWFDVPPRDCLENLLTLFRKGNGQ